MLKQRIRDNYIQIWHAKLNESNKLFYYRMFKTEFQLKNYLLITTNECLQKQLSRFRLIILSSSGNRKRGDIMVLLEKKDCANYVTLKL